MQDPMLRSRSRLQTQPRPITYEPRTPSTPAASPSIVPVEPPVEHPLTSSSIGVLPIKTNPQPEFPAPTHIKPLVPEMPSPKVIAPPSAQQPTASESGGGFVQLSDTSTPAPADSKAKGKSVLSVGLTVLAVIAFGAGIFFGVNSLRSSRYVSAQIASLRKTTDPNAPAEDKPKDDDISSYTVPAADPRILTIGAINVNARIRKLGVKANNELDAPRNIYDAGWYEGSSRPDEAGAMLIDGHIQGPTKPGIFMNLDKLKAGDQIKVQRGDGKTISYHVVKTQTFDSTKMDMQVTLNSVDSSKNGLNIISCTGQYDTKSQNYTQRLVVFAVQD